MWYYGEAVSIKRPRILILFLIFLFVGALFSLYIHISQPLAGSPPWYTQVNILLDLLEIAGLVLVWIWKKLGFYLIFIIVLIHGVVWHSGVTNVLINLIGIFIGWGILYLAIRPIWKNFK